MMDSDTLSPNKLRLSQIELTRRTVMKSGAAGALLFGLSGNALASPAASGFDPELFLLDRLTFGLNDDMLSEIQTRGYAGWLSWQLNPGAINDDAAEAIVTDVEFGYPLWFDETTGLPNPAKMTNVLNKTPSELFLQYPGETSGTTPVVMSATAVMLRAAYSRRQLFYVMADFWSNVHSTFLLQEGQHALWMPFQENVIYPHALGNYADMVKASAKHSSMMLYLNQYRSDKTSPIENYARELMELHTLGLKDGVSVFDEIDVEEVAKILTGWSMHSLDDILEGYPNPDTYVCPAQTMGLNEYGNFVFKQEKHLFGQKTVLGKVYGANILPFPLPGCHGLSEGEDLIDDLVARDETAEHMATRMIEWFLMDAPPQPLIDRVAGAFKSSGSEIVPMIQELFDATFMSEIHPSDNLKIRRPINYVVGALRASNPTIDMEELCSDNLMPNCIPGSSIWSGVKWISSSVEIGQVPGGRPSPDGYPGKNGAYVGGLRARLQFATELAHDLSLGLSIDSTKLDAIFGVATPTNDLAEAANLKVALGHLDVFDVRRVQTYINQLATSLSYDDLRRECFSMILSAPSYQYLH